MKTATGSSGFSEPQVQAVTSDVREDRGLRTDDFLQNFEKSRIFQNFLHEVFILTNFGNF